MDRYAASLAASTLPDCTDAPAHPLFRDAVLLDAIVAELPDSSLLDACLVSRLCYAVARRRLLARVRLDSAQKVEAFQQLAVKEPESFGQAVRGFVVTRSSLALLPLLPSLTPNLTLLELPAGTNQLEADALVAAIGGLARLGRLVIVGQDERSRRRRLLDHEPEGQVGQALRTLAERPNALRLQSLVVRNTPLKLSTVDAFLAGHGAGLHELVLDGCGIDARAVLLAEEFCPDLRECRLDALVSTAAPAATPRPRGPPIELVREAPLALSNRLTTLHLATLPHLPVAAFSLFSTPRHASLRNLSLLHCEFTAAHVSHFTSVTRLRIIECPTIRSVPVFVDTAARPDLGAGCRALRQLSVLGNGGGLTLENIWELAMLGREGSGGKGLARLTLDGTSTSEPVYSVGGVIFSFPPGFGTPSAAALRDDELPSALPAHLAPPAYLAPFLSLGVFSSSLPPLALLQTLLAAHDLEEISIFGATVLLPHLTLQTTNTALSLPVHLVTLAQRLLSGSLSLLPLVGLLFSPFSAVPAASSDTDLGTDAQQPDLHLQQGAKRAFALDGLPSPPPPPLPPSLAGGGSRATAAERGAASSWRAWLKRPSGAAEPEEREEEEGRDQRPRKRLREDEVAWLLEASKRSGGRLRRVHV